MLLSDAETSAYFMAWGPHFGQNLLEDLPPGTCMELRLLTLGDSQQPSYELLMRMTTPSSIEHGGTDTIYIFMATLAL